MILKFLKYLITEGGLSAFKVKERHRAPDVLQDEEWNHDYVSLSEVKLHYVHAGDRSKPLVLLLHGFPEFWYTWRHQIRYLKQNFFVVAVDMRGYGDSAKPPNKERYTIHKLALDAREVIEKLGYEKCYLIGHDWGAGIAWRVAEKYAEMVDKLVILNVPHEGAFQKHIQGKGFLSQMRKSWYMFFFQFPWLPELWFQHKDMDTLEDFLRRPPAGTRNKEAFTDQDIEAWKYTFGEKGAMSPPLNYYRNIFSELERNEFPTIQPSTLIIWGTADYFLDKEMASLSLPFCRDGRLELLEGASHWVQNDEPQACNKLIEEFLNE
jgi:pimeloyl-ACP methyl ester carboxylesterase